MNRGWVSIESSSDSISILTQIKTRSNRMNATATLHTYDRNTFIGKCEALAEGLATFFSSRFILLLMTLAIAICSSSFAFDYGLNFDKRYGILFGIALASLTFHYAKKLPDALLKVMTIWAIKGLIILTLFVAAAAWLAVATKKADPVYATTESSIASLESQIGAKNLEIAGLMASGNPINAREVGNDKTELEKQLNEKRSKLESLSKKKGLYKQGAMAIFGHLQTFTGWHQETVNLVFMFYILSVLICMEITMGAAATTPKQ